MGCACTKENPQEESESPKVVTRASKRVNGSARTEAAVANGIVEKESKERPRGRKQQQQNGTVGLHGDVVERRRMPEPNPRLSNPVKHIEGEQVAAGWPGWLSAVASEAIRGWIPRRADSFEKLDKIGQGTYSNVYKARDLDNGQIVALKKVRFDNLEPESVKFMAREIQVLRRLNHPNVIKLEGLVTSRMSFSLYLVFEYMEHDLAGLAACPGITFTEPQVKCYMQQLIRGLDHCHTRGVLHRDIKGSNLLLDNSGILKIADFGLATFFHPDQRQALTSRVVTLWYRPPELLLGATEYGAAVDLWSTGCILAELLAGKPIMPGRTEVEQLHKIFKLCGSPAEEYWKKWKLPHAIIFKPQQPYKRCIAETFKDFPASALALLDTLLAIEPADRQTAAAALESDFFTKKPYACEPSSLPQYPPSKELDAKYRDEEARRYMAGRHAGSDARRGSRERSSKAVPAPDANAELPSSLQKRRIHSHSAKSKSEKFLPANEDPAIGFPIDPPRQSDVKGASPVGRLPPASSRSGPMTRKQKEDDVRMAPPRMMTRTSKTVTDFNAPAQPADLSSYSSLVAARHGERRERRESRHREKEKEGNSGSAKPSLSNGKAENVEKPAETSKPVEDLQKESSYLKEQTSLEAQRTDGLPALAHENRMYHSGPLLRPGYSGNAIDEFLEDHERRLQQAARRAVQAEQNAKAADK
ncbi:hypothetical protein SELMODRAFT_451492 [Selaginella moellendorffii]|uniref:Uncharacterized protein CRK1-2 n=1 Tax=Selaginella moellendorffii TaxID=88036 RepID=D8RHE2_SELML|nr:hypothetical protein SELMODRAFT_451492 [Selaginella moellendorffii]